MTSFLFGISKFINSKKFTKFLTLEFINCSLDFIGNSKAMGYDLAGSSELTVIPSVCAVAVAAMAGTAADHLHANGMSLTSVRKIFQSLGDLSS